MSLLYPMRRPWALCDIVRCGWSSHPIVFELLLLCVILLILRLLFVISPVLLIVVLPIFMAIASLVVVIVIVIISILLLVSPIPLEAPVLLHVSPFLLFLLLLALPPPACHFPPLCCFAPLPPCGVASLPPARLSPPLLAPPPCHLTFPLSRPWSS